MTDAMWTSRRWAGVAGVVGALTAGGCTDTELRCRAGTSPVGSTVPLICAPDDGGPGADAALDGSMDGGADGAVDGGGEAGVDVLVDRPPEDTCLGDEADLAGDYLDQNCDGVDGVLGRQIYVSPTGSDTNDGLSPTRAFLSFGRAMQEVGVAASGTRRVVLVETGDYVAPVTMENVGFFEVRRGMSVHGGYAPGFRTASTSAATVLRGLGVGLVVRGTTDPVTLTGLTLRGTWPMPTMPPAGATGYGLVLMEAGAVRVSRSRIEAPPGGPGFAGRPPQVYVEGRPGTEGTGTTQGSGGRGCTDDSNGGDGGPGGGPSAGAIQGSPGRAPMGLMPAGPGQSGLPGASGEPGRAGRQGRFTVDGYEPLDAEAGTQGQAGGGGGGGASGDRTVMGGGGGGGGGGGCGGGGGGGGRGGGGSIALYALGCSVRLALHEVVLVASDGGRGGDGRPGTMGYPGGPGGAGGATATGTRGMPGASGGPGGNGGGGGRGAGGPSLGVALVGGAELAEPAGAMYMIGRPGPPGTEGDGIAEAAVANERLRPPVSYDSMGLPLPACPMGRGDAGAPGDVPGGGS